MKTYLNKSFFYKSFIVYLYNKTFDKLRQDPMNMISNISKHISVILIIKSGGFKLRKSSV